MLVLYYISRGEENLEMIFNGTGKIKNNNRRGHRGINFLR
jgi:hypothetical protein